MEQPKKIMTKNCFIDYANTVTSLAIALIIVAIIAKILIYKEPAAQIIPSKMQIVENQWLVPPPEITAISAWDKDHNYRLVRVNGQLAFQCGRENGLLSFMPAGTAKKVEDYFAGKHPTTEGEK